MGEFRCPLSVLCSGLVTTRLPAATSRLELAALGADVWLGAAARNTWCLAEVTLCLTSVDRATEEHSAKTKRRPQRQLVESQALATSLHDPCASTLGETQSANSHLRHIDQAPVISDAADDARNFSILVLHKFAQLGQRKWRFVPAAHVQTLEDDLVELGFSAARQELVQFDEQPDIRIIRLGFPGASLHATALFNVNTHVCEIMPC